MNLYSFSPYVRRAEHSVLLCPFLINTRVIFDYELIYVADGRCRITFDGKEILCKKGDAVLIPPGIPHKFENDGVDFAQPHMHFDVYYNKNSEITPISFKTPDMMTEKELGLIQENAFASLNLPYVFKPNNPEKFKKLLYDVIRYYSESRILCVKARVLELIGMILSQFDSGFEKAQSDAYDTVMTVKSYIDSNFMQILTLDSLALQFHTNKFTLIRNFKAAYGCSVMEYYKIKRMEYAKNALAGTSLSVSAVGEQLCFNDIYSFSRFFKNYVGVSPSEYRKQCAN